MKKQNFYFSIVLILTILAGCTSKKDFKTDVDTKLKPWTNLEFYNDPANFQFAIVSDRNGGMRPGVFEKGIEKVNMIMPEFVMCVGDLINGYTEDTAEIAKQWDEVNQIISALKMPFFYLPGNHDITNKVMQKEWEKRYGKRYYNFNYKNVLFVVLDSNDDEEFNLTREQTDYVLKTLKENENVRWTYLFMHHPIWTYDTGGRFEEIQTALQNRKHTVIAGHEHRYRHEEINNTNYYVLATTGAGSALLGEAFGQFDHISWITMTNNGPVMANIKLDGILPHDVATAKNREMAGPLIANSKMEPLVVCNSGTKFTKGTLFLNFKNPSKTDMILDFNIYHHHQLQIETPKPEIIIPAGGEKQVEIPFQSAKPLDYDKIDLICTDWEIRYAGAENKNFALQGKSQFVVQSTKVKDTENEIK
jgi:UDP-2,3-diacylglucosamine pyrophosphatase LpxH